MPTNPDVVRLHRLLQALLQHILNSKKSTQKGGNFLILEFWKKKTILKAIQKYGAYAQTDVAIEEMAELTQALIHHRRDKPSNIEEEIADVEIMLDQLKTIHHCETKVERLKEAKLIRLAIRLSETDIKDNVKEGDSNE